MTQARIRNTVIGKAEAQTYDMFLGLLDRNGRPAKVDRLAVTLSDGENYIEAEWPAMPELTIGHVAMFYSDSGDRIWHQAEVGDHDPIYRGDFLCLRWTITIDPDA